MKLELYDFSNRMRSFAKKCCLILVFFVTGSYAQIVNIPDPVFKAKLLAANTNNSIAMNAAGNWMKIDINNDSQIQLSEALLVRELNVNLADIANMTGITSFANLRLLLCDRNLLTSLDLTGMANLEYVDCYMNEITSVNLTGLTNLEYFDCSYNELTNLNLTGLPNLNFLWCADNYLTSLDLSAVPNLETLYFGQNQISNFDLSGLPKLKSLEFAFNPVGTSLTIADHLFLENINCDYAGLTALTLTNLPVLTWLVANGNDLTDVTISGAPSLRWFGVVSNELTSLDTQGLPALEALYCSSNQLMALDLSSNPLLTRLECKNNNLQSINVKNGINLVNPPSPADPMNWSNNPLEFVCIDESEAAFVENLLIANNLEGVNFNTYCSFSPGGSYHTIAGSVGFDNESNGCDSSDPLGSFVRLRLVDGTNTSYAYTNNNGDYQFYTGQGTFVVYPDEENLSYFTATPPVALINFTETENTVSIQDFCLQPNGVHPDVEIAIAPITSARPGFNARYEIVYKNKGNQTLNGSVVVGFNDNLLDLVSATVTPDVQSFGNLNWNYTNLLPFESRTIKLLMVVNAPTDAPPANLGDVLDFTGIILPTLGDATPGDNTFAMQQVVVSSYDPNDKHCLEGATVNPLRIGDYLHYVINFENTGNAAAENVVVKDMIDAEKFDLTSLQVLSASHNANVRLTGNKVEFIFEQIQLEPNAHGHVIFKIKTKNTLAVNSSVSNKADIFFDYNFPIVTNTATTTFQLLATEDFTADQSVRIFPNPTSDRVNIESDSIIQSVDLFDVNGRILSTRVGNQKQIDLSAQASGIYFLKVKTADGMKIEKVIKK